MNASTIENLVSEVFSAAVLYEDRETRNRVLEVGRHLQAKVGEEVELRFSWWRFDFLSEMRLAEQAAQAAMLADMLVISAHPGRGLPLVFTQWIEGWLPRRTQRESVLVALIGSPEDSSEDAACNYLQAIARRAGMDYLARPLPLARNLADSLAKRAETTTPLLENILKQAAPPHTHWGINE